MTDDRSLERAARSFIEAGPTQAPDRAVEAALLRIETTPQERDLRIPWRFPSMSIPARFAAVAILGALLLGGALVLLGGVGRPSVVGPSTTLEASIGPSPSSTESPGAPSAPGDWILLEHFGANAPDGTAASGPDGRSLWMIRPDGTGLHELLPAQPADGKIAPAWSPGGEHIAFETVAPLVRIFETDAAGLAIHAVSGCSGEAATCVETSPAYAPDGNQLAFAESLDGLTTNVIGIRDRCDGTTNCSMGSGQVFHEAHVTLESTRIRTAIGWIEGISWSPDGRQLVFYRVAKDADGKPTGTSELWVVNTNRTGEGDEALHRIPLPAGLTAGDPSWSPDGSHIVFSSQPIHDWNDVGVAGTPDVYTVRPDGTDLRQLTHDGGSGSPTWTSDGKILFYSQRAMWLMDADGSNAAPVYPAGPTLWGEATGWSYYGYWQPAP